MSESKMDFDFSPSTIFRCGINSIMYDLYLLRIAKAKRAALNARSEWAKEYWTGVAIELESKLPMFD